MPLTSFYTALTGLNTNSSAINVIGDNLANMNTTAFKSGKASFAELLAGLSGVSANGNPISFGLGAALNGITRNNTQGTISSTGVSTDAAINGNGYFMVSTGTGMGFTRSGKFEFNKAGNFVTADGFTLMGYPAISGVIDTNATPTEILIQKGQVIGAPVATEDVTIAANLNSGSAVGATVTTNVTTYNAAGVPTTATFTFTKTAADTWGWASTGVVGSGTLTFDAAGNIATGGTGTLAGGINVDFGVTQRGSTSIAVASQDGSAGSGLKDISIDSNGVIMGLAEDGSTVPLAQLALADFANVQGLQKYQGSTFVTFSNSGAPMVGTAGTGGRGTVSGSSLEMSNVDMAQEFINLITAQRAYQANSRIITTTDELYQESINLKR